MNNGTSYDVVVVGLGIMGSAALYSLAKRGVSVCGIEQHSIAHDQGSSHGHVRVIRKAYFEHPDYVPLLDAAYRFWEELEDASGTQLLIRNGLLISGKPDSEAIRGLEACYSAHDLPHERLSPEEASARFPIFCVPDDHVASYDPDGGYLLAEECIRQYVELAEQHGAHVRIHETVGEWSAGPKGAVVATEKGPIRAGRIVFTTGPWTRSLFDEFGVTIELRRKLQLYYDVTAGEQPLDGLPCFAADLDYGFFYGFPPLPDVGMKIAEHSGGDVVSTPERVDRALQPGEDTGALRFLRDFAPALKTEFKAFSTCIYSMTPDEHFVLDCHPEHSAVVIAGGFSGHGFKFASVVGEVVADLALDGATRYPTEFLSLARLLSD